MYVRRAEGLKASARGTDEGASQSVPVLSSQTAQHCGTVSGKKDDSGLRPLGPLGFSLRDDKDASLKSRSLQPGGSDRSYSSDEIQVMR
jgi:hypothetical protein